LAGSGKRKTPKSLKNKAMLVVRNITKQEVTNVIFPNGVTVGLEGKFFSNGFKVNGDAQVSGTLNAGGLKVNGIPFAAGGSPFLFLDVDSNVFAFDNAADTSASPTSIVLSALQVSQSATLPESAFQVLGSDGTDLISHLGSHSVVETSAGNCIRSATLTYNDSTMRTKFPITTRIVHEGLTSTKKISKVEGGTNGTNGTNGSVGPAGPAGTTPATLFLDLDTNVVSFDDSSDTTPSPSTVGITVTQTGQSSTITSGDLIATDALGGNVTISSFSSTATSTGNSTATAQISAPTDQSKYPIAIAVANEGLTSSKKVAKAVGGSSSSGTSTISVACSVDFSSGIEVSGPSDKQGSFAFVLNTFSSTPAQGTLITPEVWDQNVIENNVLGFQLTKFDNSSGTQLILGKPAYQSVFWVPLGSSSITADFAGQLALNSIGANDANIGISVFSTTYPVGTSGINGQAVSWIGNIGINGASDISAASGNYTLSASSMTIPTGTAGILLSLFIYYSGTTPSVIGSGTGQVDLTITYA
jgi:hypothetical protein